MDDADPRIRKIVALARTLQTRHGRKKRRMCVCDGTKCCTEVLKRRPDLVRYVLIRDDVDSDSLPALPTSPIRMAARTFDSIAPTVNSQGVVVLADIPDIGPSCGDEPLRFPVLVSDRIGDPGNFGTICRTLQAVGLHHFWLVAGGVEPFHDKALRSGMGAQFSLDIRMFPELDSIVCELKRRGAGIIYRTDPHNGENCFSDRVDYRRAAIILGSEPHGAGSVEEMLDLRIPMPGDAESLNVAQAATVILFESLRRNGARQANFL
jgi:TrmH family RNA methyltransferase